MQEIAARSTSDRCDPRQRAPPARACRSVAAPGARRQPRVDHGPAGNGRVVRGPQGSIALVPDARILVSRAAAAVLAGGPGAMLSHASAASLWGFLPRWSFPLEVTPDRVSAAARASLPSLPVVTATRYHPPTRRPHHHPRPDHPRHRSTPHRQATHPPGQRRAREPATCAATALQRRRWTATPCTPAPSCSGPSPRPPPTRRPPFEDEFLAFVQRYGLPTPQINVMRPRPRGRRLFPGARSSSSSWTAGTSTTTAQAFERRPRT